MKKKYNWYWSIGPPFKGYQEYNEPHQHRLTPCGYKQWMISTKETLG